MHDLAIFEASGKLAHFRRPDTLGTHATYPFFTRTSIRGFLASILGLSEMPSDTMCGLQLLNPVRTVTQELSLHGKTWESGSGAEASFSRPTSIELVVNPSYRLFYLGELARELEIRLMNSQSHYHTYLGAAFCLTFPKWVGRLDSSDIEKVDLAAHTSIETETVVPSHCVQRLDAKDNRQYARVGGMLYEHIGERRFRGSLNVLYEVRARSMRFTPREEFEKATFVQTPSHGIVCLW